MGHRRLANGGVPVGSEPLGWGMRRLHKRPHYSQSESLSGLSARSPTFRDAEELLKRSGGGAARLFLRSNRVGQGGRDCSARGRAVTLFQNLWVLLLA